MAIDKNNYFIEEMKVANKPMKIRYASLVISKIENKLQ